MKIALQKQEIQQPGELPLVVGPQADGTVGFAVLHRETRTRLVLVLSPEEATAIGVQFIQGGAAAALVKERPELAETKRIVVG
jgi:hypothetical protein